MADVPAQSLCTSCGLCCDGSIYDQVKVDPEDLPRSARLGLPVTSCGNTPILPLPCPKLSGAICTIYEDRPACCRRFRCVLLSQLDEGQLSLVDAQGRVATARQLVAAVAPYLRPGESLTDARRSWLAWNRGAESEFGTHLQSDETRRFHLAMLALNLFLDRHFRKPHQALVAVLHDQPRAATDPP